MNVDMDEKSENMIEYMDENTGNMASKTDNINDELEKLDKI